MRDEYFDRDFRCARAELARSLHRLANRLRAVGRVHQRVFWSAPWSKQPSR